MFKSAVSLAGLFLSTQALASVVTFMPENDLDKQFTYQPANLTQSDFNAAIDLVFNSYKSIVASHGATLVENRLWNNVTVNASAEQLGNQWVVNMYGGLARRPEITKDGFVMVVCHETGHHLGGFAFYEGEGQWAASEGQADYFAAQACAKKVWKNQPNTGHANVIPATAKNQCDKANSSAAGRDLCYRIADASQSISNLLAALSGESSPSADTPDQSKVSQTNTDHPMAQCRLDTYIAGSVCQKNFSDSIIPGRNNPNGQDSLEAQTESFNYTCSNSDKFGARPSCWFAQK